MPWYHYMRSPPHPRYWEPCWLDGYQPVTYLILKIYAFEHACKFPRDAQAGSTLEHALAGCEVKCFRKVHLAHKQWLLVVTRFVHKVREGEKSINGAQS